MGYMRHHALLVSTYDQKRAIDACDRATVFGCQVSPVMTSVVNQEYSFCVFPDGSKEGWPESAVGDRSRAELLQWLRAHMYEDGSNPFKYVEVQYGDDNGDTKIVSSSDDDYKAHQLQQITGKITEEGT